MTTLTIALPIHWTTLKIALFPNLGLGRERHNSRRQIAANRVNAQRSTGISFFVPSANGSVAVKRSGSYGTARSAEYLADQDLLILRDEEGLAQVVDVATGRTMRGRTLTFDLASDRILTESDGGRTWITLTPESKDVPSVEPKTRH